MFSKVIKLVSLVSAICCITVSLSYAAYVYTPNGSAVYVISRPEFTAQEIEQINEYYKAAYPNASFCSNASRTYNCHAYAWHIYLNPSSNNYWMNAPNQYTYWLDGSHVTPPPDPGAYYARVRYLSDDHSAISVHLGSGLFIFVSKWGAAPEFTHDACYCPYNCSSLEFYSF